VTILRYERLRALSFVHSGVYFALLIVAFGLGQPEPYTFVLGMAHGLLWIFMALACIEAARRGVLPLWLAVAVAVVGGIGPFAGSIGFIVAGRRGAGSARG